MGRIYYSEFDEDVNQLTCNINRVKLVKLVDEEIDSILESCGEDSAEDLKQSFKHKLDQLMNDFSYCILKHEKKFKEEHTGLSMEELKKTGIKFERIPVSYKPEE